MRSLPAEEKLHIEIEGNLKKLDSGNYIIRTALVNIEADMISIGEIINVAGIDTDSVQGRKVTISIIEE